MQDLNGWRDAVAEYGDTDLYAIEVYETLKSGAALGYFMPPRTNPRVGGVRLESTVLGASRSAASASAELLRA